VRVGYTPVKLFSPLLPIIDPPKCLDILNEIIDNKILDYDLFLERHISGSFLIELKDESKTPKTPPSYRRRV
jgi:hypothetical protein